MNHSFVNSPLDKKKCAICKFDYMAHTKAAVCESCNNVGEVDVCYGNMLMCPPCQVKEKEAWAESQKPENINARLSDMELIHTARDIDDGIRYSGDFFNAETVSIASIKVAYLSSEEYGANEEERLHAFQRHIAERIAKFKERIVELDNEKYEALSKQRAAIKSLRDLGNELRAEIREELKKSDANYQVQTVVRVPKISKPKLSPFDRIVEALAMAKGISKSEAEQLVKDGKMS
jgi:hypothetical protein